ncbi:SDR family NAD(P)-dependent oxidoreductase [Pseudomonas sp. NBRC 100443]|uniref:SDR family NAD(P)-dependent oxidoreductase n=1 Tax=Pseudomonas sp. NBRC 100443 TaxID=1113665 RepID=UPI0024A2DA61|nr:SDR family NAD(P)-dependent oxidoreductase [Pseudomonas sp. NBRC 100443]GLU37355.1 putative short-chain type dehydrogenase/reductase y4lA [Pseudomonas sp. NBRC 100443]
MSRLDDKVALVIGGGNGIGERIAHRLAGTGARIMIVDYRAEDAQRVAADLNLRGFIALAQCTDILHEEQVAALASTAMEQFGRIDVLVNSAAATDPQHMARDLDIINMDMAVWDRTLAINLRGAMLTCKHVLPHMIARGAGSIINIASAAGLAGDLARTAYGTSKAGLIMATQYIATAYGKQGVRANALAPGVIMTDALKTAMPAQLLDLLLQSHLTPEVGTPDDVANATLFLASDDSRFITGQTLAVDGGFTSHSPSYADFRRLIGG